MALAIVQHKSQINGSAIPGTFTITSAPTAGNLVVASVGMNIASGSVTINTTDWTVLRIGREENDNTNYQLLLVRYAQIGDTSTLPAFCTAGSTYSSYCVYEVSGVSGTLSNDVLGLYYDSSHDVSKTSFLVQEMVCPVNGALALLIGTRYNGSADQTITAGWTQDEAQHNSGNYGSVSGQHQSFNDGDAISGTLTMNAANNPGSWAMLLLGTGTRPTRPFIRQIARGLAKTTAFLVGSMNLGMNPLSGSLILAQVARARGNTATPTYNTTDWTSACHADGSTGNEINIFYRYASGDNGQAMPVLVSSGTNEFSHGDMIEICAVNGVFATDVVFADAGRQASGSSITTTSRNTSLNNQLGIIFGTNYNATAECSLSGSFNRAQIGDDFGNFGSSIIGSKEYPTSGTAVQSTLTVTQTGEPSAWAQIIITGVSGGASYSASLTEAMTLTDATDGTNGGLNSILTEALTLTDAPSAVVRHKAKNVNIVIIG